MKHITLILISLFLCSPRLMAQAEAGQPNFVEELTQTSNGEITIDIPEELLKEILEESAARAGSQSRKGSAGTGSGYSPKENVTNRGFRIQIFGDGRNQATLRSRATARANAVCARFPKYRGQVYTFSKAPNWYARVGNFKSRDEANRALNELRRAFPAFASEMRIVQSAIVPTK